MKWEQDGGQGYHLQGRALEEGLDSECLVQHGPHQDGVR